ncbi:PEP-CTERM sorting domain-containing protein [Candidatus Parcubacteria bacterium]|nr:PEP-CTERM sorting domain-containing protein [Candidatus Parcubacteria bacterium]
MKKQFFAILISVFLVNALFSAPVVTAGISFSEFVTAFDSDDRVWYAQLQAGSTGTTGTDTHEFEFGGSTGTFSDNDPYYTEDVSWVNGGSNSFTVAVDSANNLSVSAAGVNTTLGSEIAITDPFNEIWVGLRIISGDDRDTISVNSHQYDGDDINDMSIVDASINDFAAFKFYDDQKTDNIADFTIDGSLFIDTFGNRSKEEWTYTVFAVNNSSVPEPSMYALLFGIGALALVSLRRK